MKKKILYIDDDERSLRAVAHFLQEKGYLVFPTANPFVASLIEKERPDLIIMDIEMPLLSGDKVVEILESHGYSPAIPIIYFSAKPIEVILEAMGQAQSTTYVRKESGLEKLHEKIQFVLRQQEMMGPS